MVNLSTSPTYVDRFSTAGQVFGGLWLAAMVGYSVRPLLDNFEVAASVDPRLAWGAPTFLAVASLVAAGYSWLRQRSLWRYEFILIGSATAAACLIREPLGTIVAGIIVGAAFALGRAVLQRLGIGRDWKLFSNGSRYRSDAITDDVRAVGYANAVEELVFSTSVGLGLFACGLFVVGMAGLLGPEALGVMLVGVGITTRHHVRPAFECLTQLNHSWKQCDRLRSPLIGLATPFGGLFVVFLLMVTLAPSISLDGMLFHISDVLRFLDNGDFTAMPSQAYTYYPKDAEALFTLAWAFGEEPAASFINPAFFLLALLATFAILRSCEITRRDALFAVIVVATIPFLHFTGSIVKNDLQVAAFQLASLLAYFKSRQKQDEAWLIAGVFLLAMSFGVKHTAAFGALPLGLLFLSASWRKPKLLAKLILIGIVFGFHWHVLTFVRIGNPVHPWTAGHTVRQWPSMANFARPPLWMTYLAYPWITHFAGQATFESPSQNPMGLFIALLAPAWLLTRRTRRTHETACLFVCGVCYLFWGYIWGFVRYAIPMVMLLGAFTAGRFGAYFDGGGRLFRVTAHAALLYGFCFGVWPTVFAEVNFPQVRYFTGQTDKHGYLTEAAVFIKSTDYLGKVWKPDDLVLSVQIPAAAHSPDPSRFHHVVPGRGEVEKARVKISEHRYTYAIGPPRVRDQMSELFESFIVEYEDRWCFVAKVR